MEIALSTIKSKILEVWQHAGFQKYFRNTGWMFLGQSFNLISFLVNIWIARYLGPENFGILSYSLSFAGIFSFLANFGISTVLIRDLIEFPDKRDTLLGTAFVLMLLSGFITFIISSIFVFFTIDSIIIRNLIIIFSFTFILSSNVVIANYFQSTVQAKKNAKVQILTTILGSILRIIFILSGKGIVWFMLSYVFDYLSNTIFYINIYSKNGISVFNWKFNKNIAKRFFSISCLLILSSAFYYILLKIDQVMIGYYLDSFSVGIYAAAVKFVEIWYFIPSVFVTSLFPAIVSVRKNKILYINRLKKMYILLIVFSFFISIIMTVLAPFLINFFLGKDYELSIFILRIYIWSIMGLFLNTTMNYYFISENYYFILFAFSVLAVLLNILLNLFFIKSFGLEGAAWSTLISYSLTPFLALVYFKLKVL